VVAWGRVVDPAAAGDSAGGGKGRPARAFRSLQQFLPRASAQARSAGRRPDRIATAPTDRTSIGSNMALTNALLSASPRLVQVSNGGQPVRPAPPADDVDAVRRLQ
jgi:hypothetical protein